LELTDLVASNWIADKADEEAVGLSYRDEPLVEGTEEVASIGFRVVINNPIIFQIEVGQAELVACGEDD